MASDNREFVRLDRINEHCLGRLPTLVSTGRSNPAFAPSRHPVVRMNRRAFSLCSGFRRLYGFYPLCICGPKAFGAKLIKLRRRPFVNFLVASQLGFGLFDCFKPHRYKFVTGPFGTV